MNYSAQVSYGNRSGIQTSHLISRNVKVVDSVALGEVSENLNRFLSGHSRKNVNHTSRKFRLNEYFAKDLKAKTASTHHFLCGPLNTKRITKKIIAGNFDKPISAVPLSVKDLYNSRQINTKPPWIEEPPLEPCTLPVNQEKPTESRIASSFEFDPRFNDNFSQNATSVNDQMLQDGEVPDPTNVDLRDSCPLYDSSEYEQCPSPINVQKDTSEEEKSEPDISRYNFFVGGPSDENFPSDKVSDSLIYTRNNDKRSNRINDDVKRRKPLTREEIFVPLITWPDDDVANTDGFFVTDYSSAR